MGRVVIHPEPGQADSPDSHAQVGENEAADSTTQILVPIEANEVQSLLTIVRLFTLVVGAAVVVAVMYLFK
jgi:phage/plasmid primase-like uncharacterized protein